MVDIHCHILPKMDDGASDLEESLAMARMAAASGVTDIVATPHFPGRRSSMRLLSRLMDRYQTLVEAIEWYEIPVKLHLGAEILCIADTVELASQRMLPTIGDTDYFLTEFLFNESFEVMDAILQDIAALGYTPVVAHPERYKAVQHDPLAVQRWHDKGYVMQLNKGSVLGAFGNHVHDTSRVLLEAGLVHLIASDAHSAKHRTPHMGLLHQWMKRHMDSDRVHLLLEENPSRLLRGEPVLAVEKI